MFTTKKQPQCEGVLRSADSSCGVVVGRALPDLVWEDEVLNAMNDVVTEDAPHRYCDGVTARSDAPGSSKPTRLFHHIDFNPAFAQCFDTDYIDMERSDDPLDVLIPNIITDYEYAADQAQDATSGMSMDWTPAVIGDPQHQPFEGNHSSDATAQPIDQSIIGKSDPMKSNVARTDLKVEKDRQKKVERALRMKGLSEVEIDCGEDSTQHQHPSAGLKDCLPHHRSRANRSLIVVLSHSNIAITHKNAKSDLQEIELKYFHRPRMFRERDRIWRLSSEGTAYKETSSSSSAVAAYKEVDKQNLSLAVKQSNFVLLEYIEEFPPMVLNYGMGSAIFNYYRAPQDNEDDNDRAGKTSRGSSRMEAMMESTNRGRLPRHLLLLLQLRNAKKTYDHDVNIPRLALGETKVLGPDDQSPLLGNIEEGEILQTFTNNLFRAPIVKHSVNPSDFLLVRVKAQATSLSFVIREIPQLFICGQIEPQRIVPRPVSRITQLQEKMYMLAASRYLQAHFDGVDFSDLQRTILKYCGKASCPHKAQHRSKLKDILKKVGDEEKGSSSGTAKWYPRDVEGEKEDAEGFPLEGERKSLTTEDIAKSFTPEDVCLQEACNAAEYRFYQQHISDLDLTKVEAWISHIFNLKKFSASKMKEIVASDQDLDSRYAGKLMGVLMRKMQSLDGMLNIARFIFDRLAVAPWNTTAAYVCSFLENDNSGFMELRGIGDPSGRGEAYSFVRIAKPQRVVNLAGKRKIQIGSTDSDQRKFTKKDAVKLLVAFGMREAEAVALKRWERIRIIEDYSNKAKETGLAKDLHKYARDKVTKSSGLREQFQKAAQEIWRRQKAALRSGPHPAVLADSKQPDDGDESSDDDFAGDIEKSLAAREASSNASCLDGSRSSKALAERKQEENDHREFSSMSSFLKKITSAPRVGPLSAVAASTDVDSSMKKRKVEVAGNAVRSASYTEESVSTAGGSNAEEVHHLGMTPRPRRAVKRVSRIVRSDGSESVRIELIFIDNEVDRVERLSYRSKVDRETKRYANSSQSSEAAAVALDDDDTLDFLPTSVNAMKINLTKLRQAVEQNNALKKKEAAVAEGNEQLLIIRGTNNSCSEGKSAGKSSKRTLLSLVNSRIPRVSFAVRLEKEVMELWRTKLANVFWYPVNFMDAPGYYSRIEHPICLSDIREKIASYQYETAAALIDDVTLMASNSESYNGPNSSITLLAFKLVEKLKTSLRHELDHLGPELDSILFTEEAIRRKKVHLRKHLHANPI